MRRGWLGLLLALLVAAVLVFGSVATSLAAIPDDPDFDPVTRRFGRTRSITVEVYDRGNPGGSRLRTMPLRTSSRKACCGPQRPGHLRAHPPVDGGGGDQRPAGGG